MPLFSWAAAFDELRILFGEAGLADREGEAALIVIGDVADGGCGSRGEELLVGWGLGLKAVAGAVDFDEAVLKPLAELHNKVNRRRKLLGRDSGLSFILIRFMNRSSSKHLRVFSPLKSPKRPEPSYYEALEKTSECKLNEKIHKLKHTLKTTEKHNDELHSKIKYYKEQAHQNLRLQEELQKYKRKYEALHSEHDQKILEFQELRLKIDYQDKNATLRLKENYDAKIRELQEDNQRKQLKILQLETEQKNLNKALEDKEHKIKQLSHRIEATSMKESEEKVSKLTKIQQELQLKMTETHQYVREISKLKDSLRDSLAKLKRADALVFEQEQKNRQLLEEQKENKKLLMVIQKEASSLREGSQKLKSDNLQKVEKISQLQKQLLSLEFERLRKDQKTQQIENDNSRLQKQLQTLTEQHKFLATKHQQTLTTHYDLQREFERELHTIVKELTRRHIVSKSVIGSMGSSHIYSAGSPSKVDEGLEPHLR